MCETLHDKNVSSENICFGVRLEIPAVNSSALILRNCYFFKNMVLKKKNAGKEMRNRERDSCT